MTDTAKRPRGRPPKGIQETARDQSRAKHKSLDIWRLVRFQTKTDPAMSASAACVLIVDEVAKIRAAACEEIKTQLEHEALLMPAERKELMHAAKARGDDKWGDAARPETLALFENKPLSPALQLERENKSLLKPRPLFDRYCGIEALRWRDQSVARYLDITLPRIASWFC